MTEILRITDLWLFFHNERAYFYFYFIVENSTEKVNTGVNLKKKNPFVFYEQNVFSTL